jgi:hypothetical protein
MNKKNNLNKYINEDGKLINVNDYWNDDQLRVMRGLNIPIWYIPILNTVTTPIASEYNKKIELIPHDIKIINEKESLAKQIIPDDYKILNLNNSVMTSYINFNDISNNIINYNNDNINNYLFITNPMNKDSVDIKNNSENNNKNESDGNFFIDNIDYSLLYNIANSLKWIINKQDNKCKQENNYFLMPIQFNLNKIITTLKPKVICVMGQSLIHYFENDNHYLLKKIIKNDIKHSIKNNIKNNINIQDKLNIYHYNDTPLLFINSVDEVRNNLILKSNIWLMLNNFLN